MSAPKDDPKVFITRCLHKQFCAEKPSTTPPIPHYHDIGTVKKSLVINVPMASPDADARWISGYMCPSVSVAPPPSPFTYCRECHVDFADGDIGPWCPACMLEKTKEATRVFICAHCTGLRVLDGERLGPCSPPVITSKKRARDTLTTDDLPADKRRKLEDSSPVEEVYGLPGDTAWDMSPLRLPIDIAPVVETPPSPKPIAGVLAAASAAFAAFVAANPSPPVAINLAARKTTLAAVSASKATTATTKILDGNELKAPLPPPAKLPIADRVTDPRAVALPHKARDMSPPRSTTVQVWERGRNYTIPGEDLRDALRVDNAYFSSTILEFIANSCPFVNAAEPVVNQHSFSSLAFTSMPDDVAIAHIVHGLQYNARWTRPPVPRLSFVPVVMHNNCPMVLFVIDLAPSAKGAIICSVVAVAFHTLLDSEKKCIDTALDSFAHALTSVYGPGSMSQWQPTKRILVLYPNAPPHVLPGYEAGSSLALIASFLLSNAIKKGSAIQPPSGNSSRVETCLACFGDYTNLDIQALETFSKSVTENLHRLDAQCVPRAITEAPVPRSPGGGGSLRGRHYNSHSNNNNRGTRTYPYSRPPVNY